MPTVMSASKRRRAADLPQQLPLHRLRVDIDYHYNEDHYGRSYDWHTATVNPTGQSLTSRLPDGRHAPVIDVDRPVTVGSLAAGTAVTVTGDFDPVVLAGQLTALVESDLVHPDTLTLLAAAPPAHRWWNRRRGWVGQVTLVLAFPVVAIPSKSRNHFHLLVQGAMGWDQATELLERLALAGLADAHFSRASTRGDSMYVNTPPGPHDAL